MTESEQNFFTGPYRGLEPFDESAAAFFFGREPETRLTMASMFAAPITLLYGASGVGKSSVMGAGVLPMLRERKDLLPVAFPRFGRTPQGISVVERGWQMDPVSGLKETIALALFESAGDDTGRLRAYRDKVLEHDMSPLRSFGEACADVSGRRLMVILDQFEEYLLYHPEADSFASQFPDAVNSGDRSVSFLVSLREDSLAKLDRFKRQIPTLWDSYRRIEHLSTESALDAIRCPLREYNRRQPRGSAQVEIEDDLVKEVLRDVQAERVQFEGVGSGALDGTGGHSGVETPYLQLVMTRLWEREQEQGSHVLRLSTLRAEGGAPQIVRTHLDRVMAHFSPEERDIAARVFHRLVTPSGAKIAFAARDLAQYEGLDEAQLLPFLSKLEEGSRRILRRVANPGDDSPRYEIFHDRLGPAILAWRSKRFQAQASTPTSRVVIDREEAPPQGREEGIALCLAGMGYRAMLFHAGSILRLNEVGLLRRISRLSSVSAGSIVAGLLGSKWRKLEFKNHVATNLVEQLLNPLRDLAGKTLDIEPILMGAVIPFKSAADVLADTLDRLLFHKTTLQDLPDRSSGLEIILVATNVQTGAIWRFSQSYMGDYRVGRMTNPVIPVACAVAASAAIPPILSPFFLKLAPSALVPDAGSDLHREPFTSEIQLTDGSMADRLALETAWKRYSTILVSDGGGRLQPEAEPPTDWIRHSTRVLELIDDQLRSMRKRQVIESFQTGARRGTYWGLRTDITGYGLSNSLPCSHEFRTRLAEIPVRYRRLEPATQEQLINWGYAVCDAAIRKYVLPDIPPPAGFPFSGAASGERQTEALA